MSNNCEHHSWVTLGKPSLLPFPTEPKDWDMTGPWVLESFQTGGSIVQEDPVLKPLKIPPQTLGPADTFEPCLLASRLADKSFYFLKIWCHSIGFCVCQAVNPCSVTAPSIFKPSTVHQILLMNRISDFFHFWLLDSDLKGLCDWVRPTQIISLLKVHLGL